MLCIRQVRETVVISILTAGDNGHTKPLKLETTSMLLYDIAVIHAAYSF
jgi:hypothetical protein